MSKNVVVLDLGTQRIRASVVTQDGEILGISQTHQEVKSPRPGWAQQAPESCWQIACKTLRDVLVKTGLLIEPEMFRFSPLRLFAVAARLAAQHGIVFSRSTVLTIYDFLPCPRGEEFLAEQSPFTDSQS